MRLCATVVSKVESWAGRRCSEIRREDVLAVDGEFNHWPFGLMLFSSAILAHAHGKAVYKQRCYKAAAVQPHCGPAHLNCSFMKTLVAIEMVFGASADVVEK